MYLNNTQANKVLVNEDDNVVIRQRNINAINQSWKLIPIPTSNMSNLYKIVSRSNGKALGTNGAVTDLTIVTLQNFTGADHQKWRVINNSHGSFSLINVASGKAIRLKGGQSTDGNNVELLTHTDSLNSQRWGIFM